MPGTRVIFALLAVFLFAFWASVAEIYADTHTAASCSFSDVSAAISAASDGDTVSIPSGSCTWTSAFTITKGITLMGAGSSSTTITHGYNGNGLIRFNLSSDKAVRITGLYIKQSSNLDGTYNTIWIDGSQTGAYNLTKVRIDHNKIEKGTACIYTRGRNEWLIDNNEFVNCNIAIEVQGDSDSWNREIAAGTANSLFIEDNTFTINASTDREPNEQTYHFCGARTVIRHNTLDGTAYISTGWGGSTFFDSHGYAHPATCRGNPLIEMYNNTIHAYDFAYVLHPRGGSLLVHDNAATCDKAGCAPQFFRLAEDNTPLVWPMQDQINNSYFWNNTLNGAAVTTATIVNPPIPDPTKDFFFHAPQATGGREAYTGSPGGNMTFSPLGANAYYPYTTYTYPHPLGRVPSAPANLRIVP